MFKKILFYIPSQVIPAAITFVMIALHTSNLSPSIYGRYALVVTTLELLQTVSLMWIRIAVLRFYAEHEKSREFFYGTVNTLTISIIIIMCFFMALVMKFLMPNDTDILLATLLLFIGKGLYLHTQEIRRVEGEIILFTRNTCGQSIISVLSTFLLFYNGLSGLSSALYGLLCGFACIVILDIKVWLRYLNNWSFTIGKELFVYGAPMLLSFLITMIFQRSDRYMLGYFIGSDAVGYYSTASALAAGTLSLLFMIIVTPTFPKLTEVLAKQGMPALKREHKYYGQLLVALALPATFGILAVAPELIEIAVGEEFKQPVLELIGFAILVSLLTNIKSHYFVHPANFLKKPRWLIYGQIPAGLINIILNLWTIPLWGAMGAYYSTVVSVCVAIMVTYLLAYKEFKTPVESNWLKVLVVSLLMFKLVSLIAGDNLLVVLSLKVVSGFIIYTFSMLLINYLDFRSELFGFIKRLRHNNSV